MSSERSAAAGSSKDNGDDRVEEERKMLNDNNDNETLEPLYDELLKLCFPDSVTAIEHCRELCARFGFTVKQEASTHRNIYVYCSREGQPDSQRNPKTNPPKRKRPSKRCDCRWRIILHERDGRWEFRRSLNPEAASHNHELLRPNEIDRNWPKAVTDLIQQLAREEALTTANIRGRVQAAFPDLVWNERRFYNRLSDERQKIRHHDTVGRARRLTELWSRLCMASAGNEDLSSYVEAEMTKLLAWACEMARMDPASLQAPALQDPAQEAASFHSSCGTNVTMAESSTSPSLEPKGKGKAVSKSLKLPDPPRGFVSLTIPRHTYFVKIHSQRIANEIQVLNRSASSDTVIIGPRKRFQTTIPTDSTSTITAAAPPLFATTPATASAAAEAAAQHHRQQHYVQQQQHGVDDFMYPYNAPLGSLGGPVSPYSQNFQQHHHQQTFMQPAMFDAQPTLQHTGLSSDPMVGVHQQHVKPPTRNIHSHPDMYPHFNDGSSSQQAQTNADKSGLIHQPPVMYIAEQSSQPQQHQQASPQTPIPEHKHGQYNG